MEPDPDITPPLGLNIGERLIVERRMDALGERLDAAVKRSHRLAVLAVVLAVVATVLAVLR